MPTMSGFTFGKTVPAFGRAAPQSFGKKGGEAARRHAEQPSKQDGALDAARTVLEAATDLKDEATAEVCRRVIEASMNGRQPLTSDLRIINNYFS
jgi:hypothetical protein